MARVQSTLGRLLRSLEQADDRLAGPLAPAASAALLVEAHSLAAAAAVAGEGVTAGGERSATNSVALALAVSELIAAEARRDLRRP